MMKPSWWIPVLGLSLAGLACGESKKRSLVDGSPDALSVLPDGPRADLKVADLRPSGDAPSQPDRAPGDAPGSADTVADAPGGDRSSDRTGDGAVDRMGSHGDSGTSVDGQTDTSRDQAQTDLGRDARIDAGKLVDSPAEPRDSALDGTCVAETDADLCTLHGRLCGTLSVKDRCGTAREVAHCGTCTDGLVCAANGMVGQCETPAVQVPRASGRPVSVGPTLLDNAVFDIRAVSSDEVWLASKSALVRIRPGSAEPYYPDALLSATTTTGRLWSSSPSDVWLVSGTALLRFDGTAWAAVDAGFPANAVMKIVHGTANDDIWVLAEVAGSPEIRHYDGSTWSAWGVPPGSGVVHDIGGNTRGSPVVVRAGGVYRWNGLSFTALPSGGAGSSGLERNRVWVSPSGTIFTLTLHCDGGYYSTYEVRRLNGTAWSSLARGARSSVGCYGGVTNAAIRGVADDDVWYVDAWGAGTRYTDKATSLPGNIFSPTGPGTGFVYDHRLYELVGGAPFLRFDPQLRGGAACSRAFPDGEGGAWLQCTGTLGRFTGGVLSIGAATAPITALFTGPSMSQWLALDTGAIEQRAPGETTTHSDYLGSKFVALHGTADTNLWAVTAEGGAAHFDGTRWSASQVPIAASQKLTGIAASATSAWAWNSTALFEWNGSAWTSVAIPTGAGTISAVHVLGGIPWLRTFLSTAAALYSRTAATWTNRRTWSGYNIIWSTEDASGIYTLHEDDAGYLLERWQESGATTVGTILNPPLNANALTMLTSNSALLGTWPMLWVQF